MRIVPQANSEREETKTLPLIIELAVTAARWQAEAGFAVLLVFAAREGFVC
jgi:hypothetical protein